MSNASDFVIENGVLKKYTGPGGDVVIPEGVTSIGDKAFLGCNGLDSIIIPDSVTSIGYGAFAFSDLTEITIPDGVTSIGDEAFSSCRSLTSITLPESVTGIGNSAFYSCYKLASITLPESVTSIGNSAFSRCGSLVNITLPKGVTVIRDNTFSGCNRLTTVTIPDGVTEIGKRAFEDCVSLTEIRIPERVKKIGDNAFSGCLSLKTVSLPESMETVGSEAFFGCSNLFEITMPLTAVSDRMFGGSGKTIIMTLTQPDREPFRVVASFRKDYWVQKWTYPEEYLLPITKEAVDYYDKLLAAGSYDGFGINEEGRIRGALWRFADRELPMDREILPVIAEFLSSKIMKALKIAEQDQAASYIRILVDTGAINDDNRKKVEKALGKSAIPEIRDMIGHLVPAERPQTMKEEEADSIEPAFKERLKKLNADSVLLKYGVGSLPEVKSADGSGTAPDAYLKLILAEYIGISPNDSKLIPLAEEAAEKLDKTSLKEALLTIYRNNGNEKQQLSLMFPLFRHADGNTIREIYPKIRSVHWKEQAANNALLLNDSREAMLYADRYSLLNRYARMRHTDAATLRDTVLSEFGFDEDGKKRYDLGNSTVTVSIGHDLTLELFDDKAGKSVKSIPKKDADPEKYEAAKADFSGLKKNIKKTAKGRSDLLFEAFLYGVSFRSDAWKPVYLKNPVLNAVARLIVWVQSAKTFTLADAGAIDSADQPYTITDEPIKVAHPMEMDATDVAAWQKYFTAHDLKQPFQQIWELVRDPGEIKPDRYAGCMIPYYRFMNQEKHGIYVQDSDFHNDIEISFAGCKASVERIDWRRHEIDPKDNFEVQSFAFHRYTRQVNHIVAYLDRIAAWDRVRKDDLSVMELLPGFTLAQITEFIAAAQEANATNVLVALLEYKNAHFADFDPMAEFTLEW